MSKQNLLWCLIVVFLFPTALTGQNSNPVSSSYNSKPFSPKFSLRKGSIIYSKSQHVFIQNNIPIRIVDKDNDSLFIYPEINFLNQEDSLLRKTLVYSASNPYILLSNGRSAHLTFTDWDAKVLSIPIKIRPKLDDAPLQFVGEVALGSYAGYQFGRSSISEDLTFTVAHTIAIFAAPSMVKIDPTQANTDMSNLTLGFSTGLAYLFNLNKFQIGIVSGLDYISGDISKSWIYQGKPWLSFTIGFDFNDEESNQ